MLFIEWATISAHFPTRHYAGAGNCLDLDWTRGKRILVRKEIGHCIERNLPRPSAAPAWNRTSEGVGNLRLPPVCSEPSGLSRCV
jgi:hypothetical protein